VTSAVDPRTLQKGYAVGPGDRKLRTSVLFATLVETAFIVFLTVFLFRHANPMGDGMEMVGVSFAFMFIFLPFTLPALILAKERRHLVVAAFLAGLGAVLCFLLWLEALSELGIKAAPWD
jgi:Na+-transporting NADH:ubiquinone oxidoreductase subunit NqrB